MSSRRRSKRSRNSKHAEHILGTQSGTLTMYAAYVVVIIRLLVLVAHSISLPA